MVRWQLDGEADEAEGCRGADWLGNIDLGGGWGWRKQLREELKRKEVPGRGCSSVKMRRALEREDKCRD